MAISTSPARPWDGELQAAGLQIAAAGSATELAELMAAVGLAQNFAALRALVTHGIQKGHMRLHARSVAAAAGAPAEHYDAVVAGLLESGEIKEWKARQLLAEIGAQRRAQAGGDDPATPDAEVSASGSACGKVILLGEHAAVFDKHVLAVPLDAAITASVVEAGPGIRLSIPDWQVEQRFEPGAGEGRAAEILSLIAGSLGIDAAALHVVVRARIPPAMGLGSSAALAVAIIRASTWHSNCGRTTRTSTNSPTSARSSRTATLRVSTTRWPFTGSRCCSGGEPIRRRAPSTSMNRRRSLSLAAANGA